MATGVEYRVYAESCLRLAERANTLEARAILVAMAVTWHQLAQDQERIEVPVDREAGIKGRQIA
jgi:hypothetical protein